MFKGKKSTKDKDDDHKEKTAQVAQASVKDFFRIYTYAQPVDIAFFAVGTLASIGSGVTLPLMNIIAGKLAGNFNSYFIPGSGLSKDSFLHTLTQNTLFVIYLFVAKFTLLYISLICYRIGGLRISAGLRLAYLKAVFSQPIAVLDNQAPGFAASTITTSSNTIQLGISEKLSLFFQSSAMLITALVIAFTYSWSLTLVAFSLVVFIILVYGPVITLLVKREKAVTNANDKSSAIASETFSAIRMIAACCAEPRMIKRYDVWVDEAERLGLKLAPVAILQFSPSFFAIYANFGLVFWFGTRLYSWGDIDGVSNVIISLTSVLMIVMSVSQIANPIIAATKAATAASSFFEIIDRPAIDKTGSKEPEVSSQKDIMLQDVVFAYPSRPNLKVLDELSITFEAGKVTAIVGPSGSGKSTIVALLERWYEIKEGAEEIGRDATKPKKNNQSEFVEFGTTDEKVIDDDQGNDLIRTNGAIFIDGHELHSLDLKWWRSQIGLVQQEPFLFNDTIYRNVAYGLIGSQWEDETEDIKRELVIAACKEAFADEFIDLLPEKYNTRVGDGGIKLSGGQRQRIAIARSVVKRPRILILDEATSAIDVRAERIVQEALDRVSKGRTTITIAHRLSTIKKADKIIVLRNGKLIESGTHDSLLRNDEGVYAGLVRAQQLIMGDSEVDQASHVEDEPELATQELEDLEKVNTATAEDRDPKKAEKRGLFASFGTLIYEQSSYWLLYLGAIIGILTGGACVPISAYLMAQVITLFQLTGAALISSSNHWSLMFFMLALGTGIGYGIMGFSVTRVGAHIVRAYKAESFANIVTKPIIFFDAEENSTGTLTSRASNDPQQLQQLLGTNLGMGLIALCSLLGCVIISLSFGWKLALVGICVASPLMIAGVFYRARLEFAFERMNAEVFAESSQFASECLGAIRTVTSLTLEDMICDRYEVLLKGHITKAFIKARWRMGLVALSESIPFLCMALTFWYGGQLMSTYEYTATQFFVIYTAVINGGDQAGTFGSFGPNLAQASAAANRILSLRTSKDESKNTQPKDLPTEQSGGARLALEDIHFRYPTRDTPIFSGLSLTVEKGQFAALVGASGCGKTSIVSLLERFYDVQKGRITYNGEDIRDLDITKYRSSLSLVAQEAMLFQGSVRDNVILAVDEDVVTDEAMHEACKAAEIHDFIMSLPEGYDTQIGSKGLQLSGGQKQRLSIARALIRNPQVLLLDEATSSLDSTSEALVQAAIERAGKGRTMLVVAHRLATVQNADIIFVLGAAEHGQKGGARVLEKGNHATLLRRKGVYYQMCQSQALDR